MKPHHDYLDCAKGISIVLVVVFHSTIALQDLAHSKYWLLNNFLSPIRMPVFFFISGFLARKTIEAAASDRIIRKVATFVYLFAAWSILHLAWQAISPMSSEPVASEWIEFMYSPSSVLWFIWALAIYFCVARAGQVVNRTVIFVAALLLSFATYLGFINFENYAHENVLEFLPIFLFGVWYSEPLINSRWLRHPAAFPVTLLSFAAGFLVLYRGHLPEHVDGAATFLMAGLGVVVGLSTSIFLCRFDMLKRLPVFLGRNTLGIYVAHSPIVGLLAGALVLNASNPLLSLIGVPLVSAVAILLSLGLKHLLERVGFGWLYTLPFGAGKQNRLVPT